MQLFIGVPVYEREHPAHLAARDATRRRYGERVAYVRQPGDSCLARARAALLGAFLRFDREWTHFLQTDDDQSWAPEILERLVALDYPVVALPCALKYDPPHPYAGVSTLRGLAGASVFRDGTMDIRYMGGGFILWRRDALEALCAAHPELEFWTNAAACPRERSFWLWGSGVSEPDAEGRREGLTEDYWISHLAAEIGIQPRAYLRACSPHWRGETAYLPRGFEMEFTRASREEAA